MLPLLQLLRAKEFGAVWQAVRVRAPKPLGIVPWYCTYVYLRGHVFDLPAPHPSCHVQIRMGPELYWLVGGWPCVRARRWQTLMLGLRQYARFAAKAAEDELAAFSRLSTS